MARITTRKTTRTTVRRGRKAGARSSSSRGGVVRRVKRTRVVKSVAPAKRKAVKRVKAVKRMKLTAGVSAPTRPRRGLEDTRMSAFSSASATSRPGLGTMPPPPRGRTAARERLVDEVVSVERPTEAVLSRQLRETTRRRLAGQRSAAARFTARTRLASRSSTEVRRSGKRVVTTRARGRRREPRR